ncbi:EcsC family protein [Bacillus pinisoli]|uniref:EcsC family protein n=1 Tax=Bacillus pinisoli TaxID=2901866 RepID=UPI001FF310DA|nr:EcsC family protein [Bacillus pinisoli]
METKEELQEALSTILKWEEEQKGLWLWDRIGRLPFKLLDKMTPIFIQKKISLLLDELGQYIQTGGQYLVNEHQIFKKYTNGTPAYFPTSIHEISNLPLLSMNKVSEEITQNRQTLATVQGATTGFGGIFTLAVDIPVLLGLSLKTLQEIAISYGYDPKDKIERIFIVKCLQFSSADIVGKQAILEELSDYYHRDLHHQEMVSQLQGWREVIYTYRDQFGWKKLFQLVPVAGMIFGAFINRSMIQDISEIGRMLYQKRRITERLQVQPG